MQLLRELGKATCSVVRLGDSPELADELAALVVAGEKQATTCLRRDFMTSGMRVPKPGDVSIVTDGKDKLRCIVRIVDVQTKSFRNVDEQFVQAEGGGDRSIDWWRAAYGRYFRRQAAREGFAFDENLDVVLIRFDLVWA